VLFETELNWYYLWPVAAVCLPLSARRSASYLGLCSAAVFATIVLGNHDRVHHIALWWPGLMASLVVMVGSAVGWAGLHRGSRISARRDVASTTAGISAGTRAARVEATT
jgi:hypothetical protein